MPKDRTIRLNSTVAAVGEQLSADLDAETIVLDLRSGTYYGLSHVGARIWNLVQEPRTVSNIRDILLEEYDVEATQCERQVLALLRDLEAHKLIEVHTGTAPCCHQDPSPHSRTA